MLINDGFGTHETLDVLQFCFENNIILCRLPSHSSHALQPCDVSIFGPLENAYREQLERLDMGGVGMIGKEHFTYMYSPAREQAFTARNIRSGWSGTGLYPFNPRRVLDEIPKPIDESTISVSEVAESRVIAHDEVPQTPVTPVTAEALTTLLDRIEQIPDIESDRKLKEKLQQKHTKATRLCIAELSMLQIQNDFLTQINNEGKVRRATRPNIVGRARIMAWNDIEAATSEITKIAEEKEEKKARREAKAKEKEGKG